MDKIYNMLLINYNEQNYFSAILSLTITLHACLNISLGNCVAFIHVNVFYLSHTFYRRNPIQPIRKISDIFPPNLNFKIFLSVFFWQPISKVILCFQGFCLFGFVLI